MGKKELSNKEKLESYLLLDEKKIPFLLDENNNGKTIMLSGAWGAGKTHFWREEIEPTLSEKLKEKACVYVSLYGKESISEVKSAIYEDAYKSILGEDVISKSASLLGDFATVLGKGKNVEAFDKINQRSKDNKSEELLKGGSVICLDDFERKSKQIDLNDLFGLISHLALTLQCKLVIILNSDVFTGKEAEVFRNVKEKTVNKFFYFEPTIDELFEAIFENKKYRVLKNCKENILKVIKETEELNARVYIQVLDNCLEWVKAKRNLDKNIVRVLVLGTFNFVLNHMVLDYQEIKLHNTDSIGGHRGSYIGYGYMSKYIIKIAEGIGVNNANNIEEYIKICKEEIEIDFIDNLKKSVSNQNFISEERQWINDNEIELKALWKYGYRLYYVADVEEEIYNKIAQFIESGILI